MAAADTVARRHYVAQQTLAGRAGTAARAAWVRVDPDDIAASWADQVPALTRTISTAQALAAGAADDYIDEALDAAGATIRADARIDVAGFAGVASDGRPLASLLVQPAVTTLTSISGGFSTAEALEAGLAAITRIAVTQIADAGRTADGAAIASRRGVGYVRMLNPPSCARCAVLAGRRYRWNDGFARHPRCDCRHIPVAESVRGDRTTDPRAYFDSLSRDEQDRIFTADGARAIRDGADVGQVVNARRGMTAAGTTTEGTTRRGFAGRRLGADTDTTGSRFGASTSRRARSRQRLMPERIYAEAGDDRGLAVQLLHEHGFIA